MKMNEVKGGAAWEEVQIMESVRSFLKGTADGDMNHMNVITMEKKSVPMITIIFAGMMK